MCNEADLLWARAVAMMDRVDDAVIAGNAAEACRLGQIRDVLISWAEDVEKSLRPHLQS